MSDLPSPLVAGTKRPREVDGISVSALGLRPVASLPLNPQEGLIVTLISDGVTYQFIQGAWAVLGQGGSQGFLTRAQADAYYRQKSTWRYDQMAPSAFWTIVHNLDSMPSVHVEDSAGTTCEGDVQYVDMNTLTVAFSAAFSGKAYLA